MDKKHAPNGSDKFQIQLRKESETTIILDFKTHYQALHEFDKGVGVSAKSITGKKAKKVLFIDMEWEIDFSGALDLPEALYIDQIKNAELDGWEIWLIPHIDMDERIFHVQIIEEMRKLGIYPGPNPYSKDYVIKFENVDSILRYNWKDPTPSPTLVTDEPIEAIT